MDQEASTSSASTNNESKSELDDLALEGISVWGTNQQTLEEQALHEIDLLTQQSGELLEQEEGEIVDKKTDSSATILDINNYLKRQEELRKVQEHKRTLSANNKHRLIANKICEQNKKRLRSKNKELNSTKKSKSPNLKVRNDHNSSGSEYLPSDSDSDDVQGPKRAKTQVDAGTCTKTQDDGDHQAYKNRLNEYYKQLEVENEAEEFHTLNGGLKVPIKIWNGLYSYQKMGVKWMWELHQKQTGGILGDEMGLGKTVQLIAFLAGLEATKLPHQFASFRGLGPTLIVCPATVIHQWVKHFHDWSAEFRVVILHQSGSYQGRNKAKLISEINKDKGILITSYSAILKYKEFLYDCNWHYLILDEGHKIRNPNAKVSVAIKRIRTPHRLMLTGSPMQNNLQELWSLFDFTNPEMLGNLTTFLEHFNNPIVQGGFANATPIQEATALSVATTLKNIISPFLLRRSKHEVQKCISLPNKSEQVLFCSLTDAQRDLYKGFLMSDHVGNILGKDKRNWFSETGLRSNVLVAITALRKICNHPDIYMCEDEASENVEAQRGYYKKSGKMIVVSALLKIWKRQRHRVLLFTQSRAMMAIFERFLIQTEYKYLKMDGTTAVSSRQPLINKFNNEASYDVFLLTTRVGGLGVNLTGADRVIIYDPDWNPATDTQARERAWRIGQDKEVTIYRLLSVGTIEEKIYQRQVWKQLLSNKVLIDPKTHRFFKSSNLFDLFSLTEESSNPETANIFRDSRVKLQEQYREKAKNKKQQQQQQKSVQFSADKIQAMKNLAQQIAKSLGDTAGARKPAPEKTLHQIELEAERRRRLDERSELKKLTPVELMYLNRERLKRKEEADGNRVDGCETTTSFSQALEDAAATNAKKIKNAHREAPKLNRNEQVIDQTGVIDGEKVDGLVKREIKRAERPPTKNESQDEYVLEKLFAKKGVSGALQHDAIVEAKRKTQSLRVQEEARLKAEQALQAIRKSRLSSWQW